MPQLTSLPATASQDEIAKIIDRDGAVILTGAMDDALFALALLHAKLRPVLLVQSSLRLPSLR